jgi:GNAT superfamily N-acetyltransferase
VSDLVIRPATPADAGVIMAFIRELADYEQLLHVVEAREADIARDLFGPSPRIFCDIAEAEGQPIGFALWFYNYSTFRGRHGIYLEDLYVRPAARARGFCVYPVWGGGPPRGRGAGKALLKRLARRCLDEQLGRLEWAVLDWNAPSIGFYDSLGAEALKEWIVRRLSGEPLARLAAD